MYCERGLLIELKSLNNIPTMQICAAYILFGLNSLYVQTVFCCVRLTVITPVIKKPTKVFQKPRRQAGWEFNC